MGAGYVYMPAPTITPSPYELLTIFVIGEKPKPKGSLRHVGRGRLIEQVAGSSSWRQTVASACAAAVTATSYPGEVEVEMTFYFARPKSRPTGGPFSGSTGDLDKLMRNVGDALQDSGAIKNDSQITRAVIEKVYAEPGQETGVQIRVVTRTPKRPAVIPQPRSSSGAA